MTDSVLRDCAKQFARKNVLLCKEMRNHQVDYVLIKQTIASGTSIGANLHEAQYAQSTKDFISKLEIALKECNEVDYWLELLTDTDQIPKKTGDALRKDCTDMRRMLVSSIRTLKNKRES